MNKKYEILYIHPSINLIKARYCIIPAGAISLCNLLKDAGYNIVGINYAQQLSINRNFNLRKYLLVTNPRIILVDLYWYNYIYGFSQIIRICKEINKTVKIISGGLTATIYKKELLQNFKELDFVIYADAEEPLLALVKKILNEDNNYSSIPNLCFKKDDRIHETPHTYIANDINTLNYVDISFLHDYQSYYKTHINGYKKSMPPSFSLCIGRGCIYNCLSCGATNELQKKMFKRVNLIKRDTSKVIDDIKYLHKQNIKRVWLSHDLQIFGYQYYKEILNSMRSIDIGLVCDIWSLPHPEFIEMFSKLPNKELSCITFSPLTGDEEIRKLNGKNYTNSEFFKILNLLNKNDINIELYFGIYLPGENENSIKETIKFTNRIIKSYNLSKLQLFYNLNYPDPLSSLLNDELQNIDVKRIVFNNFYEFSKRDNSSDIGYSLPNLSLHKTLLIYRIFKLKLLIKKVIHKLKTFIKCATIGISSIK